MCPDDLSVVADSWAALRLRRDLLVDRLTVAFAASSETAPTAEMRARWLVDAVAELVGLLSTPSQLGSRARRLTMTWPDPTEATSFAVDGEVWTHAARDIDPMWTARTAEAWHQAWVLLSDILAEELLSPFAPSRIPGPAGDT